MARTSQSQVVEAEVLEQENHQTEHQAQTPTRQRQTHQEHWGRTARTTAETVVERVPEVVELTVVRQAMQAPETQVVLAVSQDQTMRPVEQKITAQV